MFRLLKLVLVMFCSALQSQRDLKLGNLASPKPKLQAADRILWLLVQMAAGAGVAPNQDSAGLASEWF
jgi:hypothetical protein